MKKLSMIITKYKFRYFHGGSKFYSHFFLTQWLILLLHIVHLRYFSFNKQFPCVGFIQREEERSSFQRTVSRNNLKNTML